VISTNVNFKAPTGIPPTTPVDIVKYGREKVEIRAKLKSPGILLLNDYDDPHWQVTVDGKRQPIIPANYLMRGVVLAAGDHTVVFSFSDPKQSRLFGIIVVCWLVLGVWWLFERKRKKRAESVLLSGWFARFQRRLPQS